MLDTNREFKTYAEACEAWGFETPSQRDAKSQQMIKNDSTVNELRAFHALPPVEWGNATISQAAKLRDRNA